MIKFAPSQKRFKSLRIFKNYLKIKSVDENTRHAHHWKHEKNHWKHEKKTVETIFGNGVQIHDC